MCLSGAVTKEQPRARPLLEAGGLLYPLDGGGGGGAGRSDLPRAGPSRTRSYFPLPPLPLFQGLRPVSAELGPRFGKVGVGRGM